MLITNTKNVPISNAKNVPIGSTKKCPFQIRKSSVFKKEKRVIFKYEKCVLFKYKNAFILNTKLYHFQIQKMSLFQIQKCAISKYEKRYRFQIRKMWSVCIFKYSTNITYFFNKQHAILRSSKCLKTTVKLTPTTQRANAISPWTACSVFDWKYLFWVNLVQKPKIISLSSNFVSIIIQICRIPW